MSARWATIGGGVLIVLAGYIAVRSLWGDSGGSRLGEDSGPTLPRVEAGQSSEKLAATEDLLREGLPGSSDRAQRAGRASGLHVRTVDTAGEPVSGSIATLWPLRDISDDGPPAPDFLEWDSVVEQALWAETDDSGHAWLPELPTAWRSMELVLWVTHTGHLAEFRVFEGSVVQDAAVFELEPTTPLRVLVVDEAGSAVPSASVYQAGLELSELRGFGYDGDPAEVLAAPPADFFRALGSFARRSVTSEGGEVSIPRLRIPTGLVASAGESVSALRLTPPRDSELVLRLGDRCTARGRLSFPAGTPVPVATRVECSWEDGLQRETLFNAPVAEDGGWGPMFLPRRPSGAYRFRLIGGDLVPVESLLAAEELRPDNLIDLEVRFGKTQPCVVTDSAGEPIEGVAVEFVWKTDEGSLRSVAWSDENGRAPLRGCPQVHGDLGATKPGHVEYRWKGIYVVTPGDIEIVLERAGRLVGQVLHEGLPVEEFQIFSWSDLPSDAEVQSFHGRRSGEFLLDTVPTGTLSLLASSPGLQESEVVVVELTSGEPQEVVLNLETGTTGSGRVVDAYTGDPLPDAVVDVLAEVAGQTLGPRGSPMRVAADGRFELEGLAPGSAQVLVSCPGRVSAQGTGRTGSSEGLEFGVIPLATRQDLEVQLLGDPPFDTSELWFMAQGEYPISYIKVDPSGYLLVPDVAPGIYTFMLVYDNGSIIQQRQDLRPGESWRVEYDFDPGPPLEIRLKGIDPADLPDAIQVGATFSTPANGWVTRAVGVNEEGVAYLNHLHGDTAFVMVSTSYYNLLASRNVELDHSGSQVVEIELTARSLEVQARDPDGTPLDEGFITINPTDPSILWVTFQHLTSTDPFLVTGISLDEVVLSLRHPELGLAFETVSMNSEGVTEVTIEVGHGLPLELHCRDIEGSVSAVRCMLIPRNVTTRGYRAESDADGRILYAGMPPNHYTADLDRFGYWPVDHEFEFKGESLIELDIRRRGNFEASVIGAGGAQLTGVEVDLRSLEFDVPVSEWVEDGRFPKGAVVLTSNVQGRVVAEGIPRGPYRWTVTKADGTSLTGTVEVPPGATVFESIHIAD